MTPPTPVDARIAALDALFGPQCPSDAPGLVVGVAQHGRSLYRRAFGLASVAHGTLNTARTRMRIGSTSKQFTCLAALLLAEQGRLDLDAAVRSHLPELPLLHAQGHEPSLRQLMTHTSGYRCHLDLGFLAGGLAIQPVGTAWATQLRQREANFAPGTNMVYCNGGYHLLSRVIERVSGLPFEQFLQQNIFEPLDMRDTCSMPSDAELTADVATLHVQKAAVHGSGWRRFIFPSQELRGEGAIISTIDDMLTWTGQLRATERKVGSAATWQQMLMPTTLPNGQVNPYALGLMCHDHRGIGVIHHPGSVIGGACQMLTVPSQALDIIIIGNGSTANPRALALRVLDVLLADLLTEPPGAPAQAARFVNLPGRCYRGRDTGLVFGFAEAAGGALGLCLLNGPPLALHDEGQQLRLPFEDLALGPLVLPTAQLLGQGGAPQQLDLLEAGRHEICDLLPHPAPPLTEAGADLLGRYHSDELAATAHIGFEGGRLLLQIRGALGSNRLDLQPISNDVFGCLELGSLPDRHAVLQVERRAGRVTGLRLDTPRTRHLAFERWAD